jgi:hypothetical protein
MKRSQLISALALVFILQVFCFAAPAAPLLPKQFAGWQMSGDAKVSKDPVVADPTNAALLNELGFTDFSSATYTREDGRKLTIRAARFGDATGAYGAFTYYKEPAMLREEIPDQGSSFNERVLFYHSNIVVDAVFEKLSAMSTSELRTLSTELPVATGSAAELPAVPTYLPKPSYVKNSAKYVMGPIGLEKIGSPLQVNAVDFADGAELVLGKYSTSQGEASLIIISYPTPQIAIARMKNFEANKPASPFFDKRSGPLVIIATGPLSQSEADTLLNSVNYEANVTWNQRPPSPRDNIGSIVVMSLVLAGILGGASLILGITFGGFRVFLKRFQPDRGLAFSEQTEFISLHLEDDEPRPPTQS